MRRTIAALSCLLLGIVAARADPVKIRVGGVAPSGDLVEILFAEPGVAKHLGQSYDYVPTHFAGTPPILTALAIGEIDIGVFSYSSFGFAVDNAKMNDLRIVMDGFQDGVPGYYTGEFMVRKDSPIRTIEDMKGKVAATPGPGTALDLAVRVMLRKHGLEDKRDYTIVTAAIPNLKAMLLGGKADLAAAGTTEIVDPDLEQQARTLFTQVEAVGRTEMLVLAARQPFLAANRSAVIDFLEDALRARRFYFDPKNHAAAVAIVAKFTKQPAAKLDPWLFTHKDYYRDPNGRPDLAALQRSIALLHQSTFLGAVFDVKPYAAIDLVAEAAKRLR
jgi:NitT/TauT family transport system substrate-binding protein